MALGSKVKKQTKRNQVACEKPHYLKPDCRPKYIRILVCFGVLSPIDGYTYDAVREHFNFNEEKPKECFIPWEDLAKKLCRTKKTVKPSVLRLVEVGILSLGYRVVEKDTPQNRYHDFDNYDDALVMHSQLLSNGLTSQSKPVPLITPTEVPLVLEKFEIKCIDNIKHIYRKMSKVEIKRREKEKKSREVDKKNTSMGEENCQDLDEKVGVNEKYKNDTEKNEVINKNNTHFFDLTSDLTVVSEDIRDLVILFFRVYEERFGCRPPKRQLHCLLDQDIVEGIRVNLSAVVEHGGAPEGWIVYEITQRLEKYKNTKCGQYNPPNLKFLSGEKSLNSYLGSLAKAKSLVTSIDTDSDLSVPKVDSSPVLTEKQLERLKKALCQQGVGAVDATAGVVESIFRKIGVNKSTRKEIEMMVTRQPLN